MGRIFRVHTRYCCLHGGKLLVVGSDLFQILLHKLAIRSNKHIAVVWLICQHILLGHNQLSCSTPLSLTGWRQACHDTACGRLMHSGYRRTTWFWPVQMHQAFVPYAQCDANCWPWLSEFRYCHIATGHTPVRALPSDALEPLGKWQPHCHHQICCHLHCLASQGHWWDLGQKSVYSSASSPAAWCRHWSQRTAQAVGVTVLPVLAWNCRAMASTASVSNEFANLMICHGRVQTRDTSRYPRHHHVDAKVKSSLRRVCDVTLSGVVYNRSFCALDCCQLSQCHTGFSTFGPIDSDLCDSEAWHVATW